MYYKSYVLFLEQQAVPTFIREITDEYVNEEEAVTFVCQYAGNPQPGI